jgi:moderate conductance mechanosensitive channel
MDERVIGIAMAVVTKIWADVLWIFLLYVVGRALLKKIINQAVKLVNGGRRDAAQHEKHARTLRQVLIATGNTVIYALIFFMILDIFGVDTRPFITGAGVIGLAIGFGSQALVRDFMSGILVLYEGQYSVGDRVKIGGFEGVVKKITMRSTVLAGKDGELVYIANGSVSNVVNYSQPSQ